MKTTEPGTQSRFLILIILLTHIFKDINYEVKKLKILFFECGTFFLNLIFEIKP